MAEKLKGQEPEKGQWVAPRVREFTPDVPGALTHLYKAARTGELDVMADLVRKAILCLKEDAE